MLTTKQREGYYALLAALQAIHAGARPAGDARQLQTFLFEELAADEAKRAEREAARKAKRAEKGGSWAGEVVQ